MVKNHTHPDISRDVMMTSSCRERVVLEYETTGELVVELGSDQTSLHNPYGGGYYPVQLGFDEAQQVMKGDPQRFRELVRERCACVCECVCVCICLSFIILFSVLIFLQSEETCECSQ